ncbi:MAG: glycerophosphodiester phosphodiesterase family protein [Chloroflexota bacterium]|nr:glycerophosphodiester phosphodiesterase family protein [Chloroflexota bacterium]
MYRTDRPLVLGHRGASAYAPMNTLPAFALAADQGADGIELDVWLSRDGFPVVIHDMTVDANTNGSGRVADMTLAELQALDAGSWKEARYAETRIPTLDEVFAAVGQRFTVINVEIKSEEDMIEGVEAVVAACIGRHAMNERVLVSSFDPRVLQRFHGLMPNVSIAFLEHPMTPADAHDMMKYIPHSARHPHYTQVDSAYMERARGNDWRVNTWTVNDTTEARRLRELGVDAIITDMPDVMLREVR